METDDIMVLVLREIRDEIKDVRHVQEQLRQEQQLTNLRLESVDNRFVTVETTVTREIVEFRKEFVAVHDLLVGRRDLEHGSKQTLPT